MGAGGVSFQATLQQLTELISRDLVSFNTSRREGSLDHGSQYIK
jgi:hypothetical protein